MNESISNDRKRKSKYGLALCKGGKFAVGLALLTFDILRELFVAMENQENEERRLHDSDLTGELNYRTGRLDAGTDPHGWYDD